MNTYKHATTMLILGLLVSLNTIACSDENNATQNTTDDMGSTTVQGDMDGTSTTDSGGTDEPDLETYDPFDDCPVAARPVYVIDADGFKLLSFDPPTLSFQEVGSVANCPSTVPDATPFSMSVDRNADAWVLYNSGELFIYEIETGSCYKSRFSPTEDFALFGMGFVLDDVDQQTDVLYIAGDGNGPGDGEPSHLGKVNFATNTYDHIAGPLSGDPELTGTASGDLWGFFPDTTPAQVARIDLENGQLHESFPISQISDSALAWAFAFWGGSFWVFYTGENDTSTRVIKVDPSTSQSTEVLRDTGYLIVGAGVSTCAPTQEM